MIVVYKVGAGLVLATCLFTSASFGQGNVIDIKAPVCKIISLPYLLGEIALNLGNQNAIDEVMPCLLKLWEEQIPNAQNADNQLSSSFLFVMEENPPAFFSAMTKQGAGQSFPEMGLPHPCRALCDRVGRGYRLQSLECP